MNGTLDFEFRKYVTSWILKWEGKKQLGGVFKKVYDFQSFQVFKFRYFSKLTTWIKIILGWTVLGTLSSHPMNHHEIRHGKGENQWNASSKNFWNSKSLRIYQFEVEKMVQPLNSINETLWLNFYEWFEISHERKW